jgi:hypothetical protein
MPFHASTFPGRAKLRDGATISPSHSGTVARAKVTVVSTRPRNCAPGDAESVGPSNGKRSQNDGPLLSFAFFGISLKGLRLKSIRTQMSAKLAQSWRHKCPAYVNLSSTNAIRPLATRNRLSFRRSRMHVARGVFRDSLLAVNAGTATSKPAQSSLDETSRKPRPSIQECAASANFGIWLFSATSTSLYEA